MMRLTKSLTALAAVAAITAAGPAFAQRATYCNGNLVANSFYSNVLPASGGANVEYHGQFQNQDPQRRALTATMLTVGRIGNFTVLRPVARFDLNPYEQKDVTLLALHTSSQSGAGAPPPFTVGQTIRFSCTFR